MLIVYTGCSKRFNSLKPHKDYSAYLESIIALAEKNLTDVKEYQGSVTIDLSPAIAELERIKSEMQNISDLIEQNTESLLAQFLAVANQIEGFNSSSLNAMNSFSSLFKLESDESQALLSEISRKISQLDSTLEVELLEFDFTIASGSNGGNYFIPAGTVDLAIIAKTCDSFLVNELEYSEGMHLNRDWRVAGRKIVVNSKKEVMLMPNSEHHVSYTAFRNIGDIKTTGDLSCRKGRQENFKAFSESEDLTSLIDLAQSAIHNV